MKRFLAYFLALVIVSFSVPYTVYASPTAKGNSWQSNGFINEDGTLKPGGVRGRKTVVNDSANTYTVTIEAESSASTSQKKRGILFLIDSSNPSNLENFKSVIASNIPTILNNSENDVAIAQIDRNFAGSGSFYDKSGESAALTELNSLSSQSSALHLEKGISSAKSLFPSGYDDTVIFILTQGNITHFSRVSSISAGVTCLDSSHISPQWDITPSYEVPKKDTTSLTNSVHLISSAYCNYMKKEYYLGANPPSIYYPTSLADTAIYEAKQVQSAGINLHVGSLSNVNQSFLTSITSNYYYSTSDIENALKSKFLPDTASAVSLNITDSLPDFVNNLTLASVSSGTAEISGNTIVWRFSDLGTLTYTFNLSMDHENYPETGRSAANSTTIQYNNGTSESFQLNNPIIKGDYNKLFAQAVLVNDSGHYIGEDGSLQTTPEAAEKLSVLQPRNNNSVGGYNRWGKDISVTISASSLTLNDAEEYQLYDPSEAQKTVQLDTLNTENTVFFKYVKKPLRTYPISVFYTRIDDIPVEYHSAINGLNAQAPIVVSDYLQYVPASKITNYELTGFHFNNDFYSNLDDDISPSLLSNANALTFVYAPTDLGDGDDDGIGDDGDDGGDDGGNDDGDDDNLGDGDDDGIGDGNVDGDDDGDDDGNVDGNDNDNNGDNGNTTIDPDKEVLELFFDCTYSIGGNSGYSWVENKFINANTPVNLWQMFQSNNYQGVDLSLLGITVETTPIIIQPRSLALGTSDVAQFNTFAVGSSTTTLYYSDYFAFSAENDYKISMVYRIANDTTIADTTSDKYPITTSSLRSKSRDADDKSPSLDKASTLTTKTTVTNANNTQTPGTTTTNTLNKSNNLPKTGANPPSIFTSHVNQLISLNYVVSSAGGLCVIMHDDDDKNLA